MNPFAILKFATSPAGRALGAGLMLLAVLGYGYMTGLDKGRSENEADALRARLAAMEKDLATERAAEEAARMMRLAAEARRATLEERLGAYEADLVAGNTPDVCRLSDGGARRLRSLTD